MVFLLRLNQTTIELIGLTFAACIFITFAGCLLLFGASAWQKFRIIRAQADQETAKACAANYPTYQDGFGMIHLHNLKSGTVENLSTYPGSHHNGHWEEPPQSAMLAWFALVSKSKDINKEIVQLPAGQLTIEQKPSLLELIDQYPHCHIYGGTGGGKTGLLRTIAYRRQLQGHQVLILDSTEHPSRWQNLTRIRNRQKQNEAIEKLFSIYHQNEEALSSGKAVETDFKQITIISDEWTDIVAENNLAKQFIREQIRKVRKFGLHLVFATQTDLASDLGLDGAYKTTSSFLKIEVKKLADEKRIAIARIGYQQLGEFEVPIPPPLPQLLSTGYVAPTLETVKLSEVTLTDGEKEIINLIDSGLSFKEISEYMWGEGKFGKFYNDRINRIIARRKKLG